MNARLYDPLLGRMCASDNLASASSTQSLNRYTYAGNRPLVQIDPDGNCPICLAVLAGALIGAGTSSAIYTVTNLATNNFTWEGLGKSALYGAVSGAIGGGISSIGTSLFGSVGNSIGYSLFTNAATNIATNLALGNKITTGSVLGSLIGGALDGAFPQFKGFETTGGNYGFDDVVSNLAGDVISNVSRGGFVGGISGGIGAAIDGTDVGEGFINGVKSGAIAAFSRSVLVNGLMGTTIRPSGKVVEDLRMMGITEGVDLLEGPGSPIYRAGGALGFFASGITVGRSLMIGDKSKETWVHESYHYVQQQTQSWSGQLGHGMYEQWIVAPIHGDPFYPYITDGHNYNEFGAQYYQNHFHYHH